MIESSEHKEKVKISVKFQDRNNNKLDFKVNFHDVKRKADVSFHSGDSGKSSEASPHPPKKKWIRHYMTGKVDRIYSETWQEGVSFPSNFFETA